MNRELDMYRHFNFQAQTDATSGVQSSAQTETPAAHAPTETPAAPVQTIDYSRWQAKSSKGLGELGYTDDEYKS